MTHDLDEMLAHARQRILHMPSNVRITWAPDAELDEGNHWAQWRHCRESGHWIGISDRLQDAPRYVVQFIVVHEALHTVFRMRGHIAHSRAFRVAEYLWPDYDRAERWLEAHA